MDNIINFIGDYFNPKMDLKDFLEYAGHDEDRQLEFYDELLDIRKKTGDPIDKNDYPEGMSEDDIWDEVFDDELNTTYSWQYESLQGQDEISDRIYGMLKHLNEIYADYMEEQEGGEDEDEPTEGSRINKMNKTAEGTQYFVDMRGAKGIVYYGPYDSAEKAKKTFMDLTKGGQDWQSMRIRVEPRNEKEIDEIVAWIYDTFDPEDTDSDITASINKTGDEAYQGWTNHETWAVNLWFSNDEGLYRMIMDYIKELKENYPEEDTEDPGVISDMQIKLEDWMKDFVEEENPIADQSTMYADILNSAIMDVNWREIAGVWIESAKE